jgi:predicted RNA-binding protein YlxR (DUF448 family)
MSTQKPELSETLPIATVQFERLLRRTMLIKRENLISARICLVCRRSRPRPELLQLTVDHVTNEVYLVSSSVKSRQIFGRSAYLCRSQKCLTGALKGTRLKHALEGRKAKEKAQKRSIRWPLAAQFITVVEGECTEP